MYRLLQLHPLFLHRPLPLLLLLLPLLLFLSGIFPFVVIPLDISLLLKELNKLAQIHNYVHEGAFEMGVVEKVPQILGLVVKRDRVFGVGEVDAVDEAS